MNVQIAEERPPQRVEVATAARFSFLLSVPAILGAMVLQAKDGLPLDAIAWLPLSVGFLAAVVVGYFSLVLLVALVNKGRLHNFIWYLWPVGIIGLIVLAINANQIPEAISMVFSYAFSPAAAEGGFAGAAVWAAIRFGVARGIFSNEAGLGSAPIAHAAAQTKNPVKQGMVAMLGTFIDTIIVCSITGLVIITSGAWTSGETGAALTSLAFETGLPGFGNYVVAIALAIFAFTTIIGWSFYGERCIEFLFGVKAILPYRVLWIVAIPVGATINLGFIWLVADTLNAMMALPNLIALLLLSPVVFKLTREHFEKQKALGVE